MRIVTPPALKWLIRRRGQVAGNLLKAHQSLATIDSLLIEADAQAQAISRLKRDLSALDVVISQHDIPIEPAIIPSTVGQRRPSFYAHGGLVRAIYKCLREAKGHWRTTTEVTVYVAAHCARPILEAEDFEYRHSVRKMLGKLYAKGTVMRTMEQSSWRTEARWALSPALGINAKPSRS
jgi:hypothetical protein